MVNKNHPDYPKMMEEFHALLAELRNEKDSLPKFTGLDGPECDIDRKYVKKIKELQDRYPQLYEDSEP